MINLRLWKFNKKFTAFQKNLNRILHGELSWGSRAAKINHRYFESIM